MDKIYSTLSNIMDKRDEFFSELKAFEDKHHFIPFQYEKDPLLMNAYSEYKSKGSWRSSPGVVRVVRRAAKMAEKKEISR